MDRDLWTSTTGAVRSAESPGLERPVTWDEWAPPPPPTERSVPLRELLLIAVLRPTQAVLVTADLLQATGTTPSGRVHAVLRADGTVDVTGAVDGAPGVPFQDLMDDLVRNARRLPAHPRPDQVRLLHHVEAEVGATGDPAARALALRETLTEVVGVDAVTRVRRELAALVEAFNAIAVSRPVPSARENGHPINGHPTNGHPINSHPVNNHTSTSTSIPTGVPPTSPVPTGLLTGPGSRQAARRPARRRHRLVIPIVLVLALVGAYLFLRGPGSGMLDSLRGGDSNPSGTHRPARSHPPAQHRTGHAATHHRKAFPALAAHSSGRIRGVVLQKNTSCRPGTACGVTVTVQLAPAGVSQVVGWRVGVARRCVRRMAWSPETTVTAQPGWTRVFASSSVLIPKGKSLALVALTSTPKHAQSRPAPVAGASLHC